MKISDIAGDEQSTERMHQVFKDTVDPTSLSALSGSAALLSRDKPQGSVTATPRGIVAKSVVDRIIAEL